MPNQTTQEEKIYSNSKSENDKPQSNTKNQNFSVEEIKHPR